MFKCISWSDWIRKVIPRLYSWREKGDCIYAYVCMNTYMYIVSCITQTTGGNIFNMGREKRPAQQTHIQYISKKMWVRMPVVICWHIFGKCNKICHVIQELWTFSLTGNGRTDIHSDYSADPWVMQWDYSLLAYLSQRYVNICGSLVAICCVARSKWPAPTSAPIMLFTPVSTIPLLSSVTQVSAPERYSPCLLYGGWFVPFRYFVLIFVVSPCVISSFRYFAWRFFVFSSFRSALLRLGAAPQRQAKKTKWHKPATILLVIFIFKHEIYPACKF